MLVLALGMLIACAATALSGPSSAEDRMTAAERWAWSRINQGLPVDFADQCGGWLDPRKEDDPAWSDAKQCRTISGSFLVDILARSPLRDAVPYKGLDIRDAKIVGGVDLAFAKLDRPIRIADSRFEGALSLSYAGAKSVFDLDGSLFIGMLDAFSFHSESHFVLAGATFSKAGLALNYAAIAGFIDMRGVTCPGDLNADALQVGGSLFMGSDGDKKANFNNVILNGAKVIGQIDIIGATFAGDLSANSLQVGEALLMRSDGDNKASFKKVILRNAKVTGEIVMDGASFAGDLDANSLYVGGSLLMRSDAKNKASFRNVSLNSADVTGHVSMIGASFAGDLDAGALQVGGSLLMQSDDTNKASFGKVSLHSAKVTGEIDMIGASFAGDLDADSLQVGGSLFMRSDDKHEANFKTVDLEYATVKSKVDMDGAVFGGEIIARGLPVAGDVSRRDVTTNAPVTMPFTQFGSNLDLGDAKLSGVDLRGASIAGEMRLGDRNSMVSWAPPVGAADVLDLRNTHAGSLSDNKDSWPEHGRLHLDGFTFAHLGGFESNSGLDMIGRGARWWDRQWARLDNGFSTSPYEQLAAAFAARETATRPMKFTIENRSAVMRKTQVGRAGLSFAPVCCVGLPATA